MQRLIIIAIAGIIVGWVGPLLLGWTVNSGSAQEQTKAALTELKVELCTERALAANAEAASLDFNGRRDLAREHAIFPGSTSYDTAVANACARELQKPQN